MTNGESGSVIVRGNEESALYSYYPLGIHNMSICIVSPVKEAFSLVEGLLYAMGFAVLLLCVVGMTGTFLLSAKMNTLIHWIGTQTAMLAKGNTSVKDKKLAYVQIMPRRGILIQKICVRKRRMWSKMQRTDRHLRWRC